MHSSARDQWCSRKGGRLAGILFNSALNHEGRTADFANLVSVFSADKFAIDTTGVSNAHGSIFSVVQGNDSSVTCGAPFKYTSSPPPSRAEYNLAAGIGPRSLLDLAIFGRKTAIFHNQNTPEKVKNVTTDVLITLDRLAGSGASVLLGVLYEQDKYRRLSFQRVDLPTLIKQ